MEKLNTGGWFTITDDDGKFVRNIHRRSGAANMHGHRRAKKLDANLRNEATPSERRRSARCPIGCGHKTHRKARA